mgnify:CR=1 FL=1
MSKSQFGGASIVRAATKKLEQDEAKSLKKPLVLMNTDNQVNSFKPLLGSKPPTKVDNKQIKSMLP